MGRSDISDLQRRLESIYINRGQNANLFLLRYEIGTFISNISTETFTLWSKNSVYVSSSILKTLTSVRQG